MKDLGFTKYFNPSVNIRESDKNEVDSPMQLKGQASIQLTKDAHIHGRSKHIDVTYHHIRDLHKRNRIQVDYVPSEEMIADGLTKPLNKPLFKRFIDQLKLVVMCKVTRLMPSKVFRVTWYRIGISALVRTLGNTKRPREAPQNFYVHSHRVINWI